MATIVTPKIETTPAVMEFQLLTAKISNRLANTNQQSGVSYWMNEMDIRTKAIAKAYGISVNALITQWETWYAQVELAQAKAKAGN